ncbi:MAG: zinc-dependent peptidase [Myxococcales bacterium]|nr:zinc-dependent peptidase [Myxococcales bacterium]
MFGLKKRRRRRWREMPFPAAWLEILEQRVPYYRLLSADDRRELQGHIQVFLHEKTIEGLGGLEMTDEIRVSIAAQACILLLHRETDYYPSLFSILVYPHKYFVKKTEKLPDGTVMEGYEGRLGESWHRGEVVLSWDDVKKGAVDVHDGNNVVFHEFAHQLDGESGAHDGTPALPRLSMYGAWARVFTQEYKNLIDNLEHHRRTLISSYGATNPAEFFAVVTEAFFERPLALKRCHPDLYEQLRLFYQQDTAARLAGYHRQQAIAAAACPENRDEQTADG